MGQSPQLHPQEDPPFFLFLTILTMMAVTTAIRAMQIIMVAKFSAINVSIRASPFFVLNK